MVMQRPLHFTPDADTLHRAQASPEYRALVQAGGKPRFLLAGEIAELRTPARPIRALAELAVLALFFSVALIIIGSLL